MRPPPVPLQAFARRGLVRSLLALPLAIRVGQWPPLPAQAAGLQRQTYSSSDGACHFSVPLDWRLVELCSPNRGRAQCEAAGRRVIVAARSPDGSAVATVTVDLGAYGKKLTDFASLQTISEGTLPAFEGSTLREAMEVASRRGSLAPNYYVLRFEQGRFEHVVKLTGLTAVAVAALLHASPVVADGYEEALRLCPDERVVCVSSLDAGHFLEPWEYDGALGRAVLAVAGAAEAEGGIVERDDSSEAGTALRVRFPRDDVAVFWFPSNDALVNFRSERVDGSLWDRSANKPRPMSKTRLRLDRMRKVLGYAPAPMVKNRRALPSERRADGSFQLEEERPYKRRDGRFYGEQGGGEPEALTSLASPEALRRLLFPFARLGGRASPAQALYDDLIELSTIPLPPRWGVSRGGT